jgi:hypothetical protein
MNADGWPASPQLDLAPGLEISGKAFSTPFRILALLMVEGVAWWGYMLWSSGKLGTSITTSAFWLLAALVLMCATVFFVFRSVTSISASHIKQSWIWDKEMSVADLAYAKLIRLKGFDWLIAPRLYARTHGGKFASFYAANANVLQQFELLSAKLR